MTNKADYAIEVERLTKRYGNLLAVNDISFTVKKGEMFATGSAEAMIANCDVLITQFSSTAFVGLALGKETYSDVSMNEMRRLLPVQNGSAARNIASVCRRVLEECA